MTTSGRVRYRLKEYSQMKRVQTCFLTHREKRLPSLSEMRSSGIAHLARHCFHNRYYVLRKKRRVCFANWNLPLCFRGSRWSINVPKLVVNRTVSIKKGSEKHFFGVTHERFAQCLPTSNERPFMFFAPVSELRSQKASYRRWYLEIYVAGFSNNARTTVAFHRMSFEKTNCRLPS